MSKSLNGEKTYTRNNRFITDFYHFDHLQK